MTIHWCGTGLSSVPGLRSLIEAGRPVTVWNRTAEHARDAVGDITGDIRAYSLDRLRAALSPGDVAVSMLPADHHVAIASACLEVGANFVSSSYIAPAMRALDERFRKAGLVSQNEVGLDPGIDHLMAHDLVGRYRASAAAHPANEIAFTSYCGGIPKNPNPFRYKFSWAPAGVLRALRSPARALVEFQTREVARPWHAVSEYVAPLPHPETFEVYPNRDSLPFMAEYAFDPAWKVREFVRGTLRLKGWKEAWAPVFATIESLDGMSQPEADARIETLAGELVEKNAYAPGEPDRVVLFVTLAARRDGRAVFHESWAMDAWGDARGSAMARLVSGMVAMAVEAVLAGEITPGVHSAPRDAATLNRWLGRVHPLAQHLERVDHLA